MVPGQAMEIQAQFEILEGDAGTLGHAPKFPILVRCDYDNLLSAVEIKSDYNDSHARPVHMELKNSARVLHRKV